MSNSNKNWEKKTWRIFILISLSSSSWSLYFPLIFLFFPFFPRTCPPFFSSFASSFTPASGGFLPFSGFPDFWLLKTGFWVDSVDFNFTSTLPDLKKFN